MDAQTLLIASFVAAAVVLAVLLELRRRRTEDAHKAIKLRAEEAGLNEPASLHPVIDVAACIGSAACVAACPEGTVLGIVEGRGTLVQGSKCVGHGRCLLECPVDAIRLVFGTSERGVDIPHVSEHYESNVPGIFVVGELGGMGLVRNAVRQGVEGVEHLARQLAAEGPAPEGVHDVVIVGAGPAGVAAAITARKAGLDLRLLERERSFGGAILHFPRAKIIQTKPLDLPAYGCVRDREIAKERMLDMLQTAAAAGGVEAECGREVSAITSASGADGNGASARFSVRLADGETLRARRVVLAIGRRGMPRKLGVPGEEQRHVHYGLLEPEEFRGHNLLVVGGGNSAVEAALLLADQEDTRVSLSYRRSSFPRLTERNRERIDHAAEEGSVKLLLGSQVREIATEHTVIEVGGVEQNLPTRTVFVMIGGVLPRDFLEAAGIAIHKKFGEP